MSRRAYWHRTFKNDPHLKKYFLEGVVPTGKTLGVGSYGSVLEMKYKQTPYAAKQMHELLLDPGNEGVRDTIQKYQRECQLMADLRHPNITQFLGLCFLESSQLPLLVMERLEMSVDDLLECSPNIPLPVKLSILTDTCSGLVYLHGMKSPIVHRDLTARNVLLTSSLSAKITDLGNSRIVNLRPGQLARTLSKLPGTLVYMPPEALTDSHRYGPSLDVFSFGHLSLYILTQVFPGELQSATVADPDHPGRLIAHSEVQRREVYMRKLELLFSESHSVLIDLVSQCLHNNPQGRPSSEELLGRLCAVQTAVDKLYGGNVGRHLDISKVLLVKEIKLKNKTIQEFQVSESRLEAENRELVDANGRLEEKKKCLEVEKSRIMEDYNQLQLEKNHLIAEINQLGTEKRQILGQHEADKRQYEEEKQQLEEEKQQLMAKNQSLLSELHDLRTQLEVVVEQANPVTFPLQLHWRSGPDMPFAMSDCNQSVEVEGTVYVGGGETDIINNGFIVMAYNMKSCQWHTLPPYIARLFAMTTINNKLVLVGGLDSHYKYVNQLGVWQTDSNQWTHPFPPMSTPCYSPSVTLYKHWLVVAGGYNGHYLSTVEVLDVDNKQWFIAPSTPTPWCCMRSTILGDTWYLMGGWNNRNIADVYSVSLEALVSHSTSDSSNIWGELSSFNCDRSCLINIEGSLLALGVYDYESGKPVSTIQHYLPESNKWVLVGELPCQLRNCSCIMTAGRLHVFGGYINMRTSSYYFSNLS